MWRSFIGLLSLTLVTQGATALAQSVPQEITGYRAIDVTFSANAHKCNLKDSEMFTARLRDRLSEIGIEHSDQSIVVARIGVTGFRYGLLGGTCASQTQLTFQTVLRAENIVTDNPAVRRAVDRLQVLPIILYDIGSIGVQPQTEPDQGGPSVTSRDAVFEMIDSLVERFDQDRK